MAFTAQEYLDRMEKTRAAHLGNIDTTGKRIQGIYLQAARDLAKEAERAKDKSLTKRWLTDYQRAVEERMAQMRGELGSAIRSGMRASARLPGETVEAWLGDALAMCGVEGSFSVVFSQTPDDVLRALLDGRMYRDGKSLSQRIWSRTDQLAGNIEDIVAQGIAQHRSALDIAKDLEAYVSPKAKMPVSWLKIYPDIPFDRQIEYNAMRLARTAINHSYWAANVETALKNPFCMAMHWALSASHYERQVARFGEDVCDTYASHDEGLGRGNFPIKELPMPHAQCLCVQYQVVPSLEETANRLSRWVDGGEDAELERAFGEWKAQKDSRASAIERLMLENIGSVRLKTGQLHAPGIEKNFGELRTNDVILTYPSARHIEEGHPEAMPLIQPGVFENPDLILRDEKHEGTVFVLQKKDKVYLNLIVRLALQTDAPEKRNSIITGYLVREKNVKKLLNSHDILYSKE